MQFLQWNYQTNHFPDCTFVNFTQINYQHLVDYLLEPALNQNITDKTKFIIKEYLQSIKSTCN